MPPRPSSEPPENGASKAPKREGDTDIADAKDEEKRRKLRSHSQPPQTGDYPTLTYKEGEILEFPKHYNPKTAKGSTVKVVVPAESLSCTNRMVKSRQLWGNDMYTHDSDVVAILMHMGFYSSVLSSAPQGVTEAHVLVSTHPVEKHYIPCSRHNIRSRAWSSSLEGCSIKVESCFLITRSGVAVELKPARDDVPVISPTFMPAAMERVMNTRSSASSVDKKRGLKQEVTVQYNLCNEPWLKFCMGTVADQGLQPSQWTSARMHSEVLYLETQRLAQASL